MPDGREAVKDSFQTKSLWCSMDLFTITAAGRLIYHKRRYFLASDVRPYALEHVADIDMDYHGDLEMHGATPDGASVRYAVRFTHGTVEWIRQSRGVAGHPPVMAAGTGIVSMAADRSMATDQCGAGRVAAAILARVVCPEKADWPAQAARDLLRLRFAEQDLDQLHLLLARHYRDILSAAEEDELAKHLFVNCLLSLIHERARRSLDRASASGTGET